MKSHLSLLLFFIFSLAGSGQNILYDLDSYKRVSGIYRTTFITPDANLNYQDVINLPGQEKSYGFEVGGNYTDNQIQNDEKNQKTKFISLDLGAGIGTKKNVDSKYRYSSKDRSYNGMKYFKSGFQLSTENRYDEIINLKRFTHFLDMGYDLGFGFGRLEVINNAWIGARILEELESNNLLLIYPTTEELTELFDFIGDLEFERVMDPRLRSIYRVEKMIEFIENKGWIEKGSIPSFVRIYEAFLFENFVIRESGERLEFTLRPTLASNFIYTFVMDNQFSKVIRPGFLGTIEYEIHKNGDIAYNTKKLVGGRLEYIENFRDAPSNDFKQIAGNIYFQYRYRYLPSLRTNFIFSSNIAAGFIYAGNYTARLDMNSLAEYDYYFSPVTRLAVIAEVKYIDSRFQVGNFQPAIDAKFSVNVVHALR